MRVSVGECWVSHLPPSFFAQAVFNDALARLCSKPTMAFVFFQGDKDQWEQAAKECLPAGMRVRRRSECERVVCACECVKVRVVARIPHACVLQCL